MDQPAPPKVEKHRGRDNDVEATRNDEVAHNDARDTNDDREENNVDLRSCGGEISRQDGSFP
eukprot:351749-Amphidinium_carterae.1